MCGFGSRKRSGSADSSNSWTTTASDSSTQQPPFRLLDLPTEIVLQIISLVSRNRPFESGEFPSGPSEELCSLSQASKQIHDICRPLVFQSISWKYQKRVNPRSLSWRAGRGLRALLRLAEDSGRGLPPIQMLSVVSSSRPNVEETEELDALSTLLAGLSPSLKVLWLRKISFDDRNDRETLLASIVSCSNLSAIRFNQVEAGSKKQMKSMAQLPALKTLQVMHGSSCLLELVRLCPNLESLLLWPESRRLGTLVPVISSLLPKLRFLSLDAVSEPSCFSIFGEEIEHLAETGVNVPMEELFFEGAQTRRDMDVLVRSLAKTSVRRLALYHLRNPKPSLLHDIALAVPDLEALVPSPASEGSPLLHKEYNTLARLGEAIPSLETAVCILLDVSEGASGYFTTFAGTGEDRRLATPEEKTVKDFLIGFDRWVVA
ncbi:hypothetical protein MNV49_002810 [Pseudohyphozyma bogoriensis]|nr:hypothetical protein MNV49_002810 [Pseudohyphozyma bogoriensis]